MAHLALINQLIVNRTTNDTLFDLLLSIRDTEHDFSINSERSMIVFHSIINTLYLKYKDLEFIREIINYYQLIKKDEGDILSDVETLYPQSSIVKRKFYSTNSIENPIFLKQTRTRINDSYISKIRLMIDTSKCNENIPYSFKSVKNVAYSWDPGSKSINSKIEDRNEKELLENVKFYNFYNNSILVHDFMHLYFLKYTGEEFMVENQNNFINNNNEDSNIINSDFIDSFTINGKLNNTILESLGDSGKQTIYNFFKIFEENNFNYSSFKNSINALICKLELGGQSLDEHNGFSVLNSILFDLKRSGDGFQIELTQKMNYYFDIMRQKNQYIFITIDRLGYIKSILHNIPSILIVKNGDECIYKTNFTIVQSSDEREYTINVFQFPYYTKRFIENLQEFEIPLPSYASEAYVINKTHTRIENNTIVFSGGEYKENNNKLVIDNKIIKNKVNAINKDIILYGFSTELESIKNNNVYLSTKSSENNIFFLNLYKILKCYGFQYNKNISSDSYKYIINNIKRYIIGNDIYNKNSHGYLIYLSLKIIDSLEYIFSSSSSNNYNMLVEKIINLIVKNYSYFNYYNEMFTYDKAIVNTFMSIMQDLLLEMSSLRPSNYNYHNYFNLIMKKQGLDFKTIDNEDLYLQFEQYKLNIKNKIKLNDKYCEYDIYKKLLLNINRNTNAFIINFINNLITISNYLNLDSKIKNIMESYNIKEIEFTIVNLYNFLYIDEYKGLEIQQLSSSKMLGEFNSKLSGINRYPIITSNRFENNRNGITTIAAAAGGKRKSIPTPAIFKVKPPAETHTYNGKRYRVRTGKKGGKFIVVKSKKDGSKKKIYI